MIVPDPPDPIAAVIHPDPYPYYSDLVERTPFYRDERSGLWVAASAAAVEAVLTSNICRVRPVNEPIPAALTGSSAAVIFQHLVRMNDGERHDPLKQAVSATMHALATLPLVEEECRKWARMLWQQRQPRMLQDFAFRLPLYVVASLSGVPQEQLHQVALWMDAFVRCLAPASTPEQVELGKVAADYLLALFELLVADAGRQTTPNLLTILTEQAAALGCDDRRVIAANGIGFLSQAYEATAGLIGNTVVALAAHPDVRAQVAANSALLRPTLAEVLRYDAPIQNTRRFIAQSGIIMGQTLKAGDVVLLVLAAANRDAALNPHPQRFDLFRRDRRLYTLGSGPHSCPGEMLAMMIAQAGVELLLAEDVVSQHRTTTYRPSPNARIALLSET